MESRFICSFLPSQCRHELKKASHITKLPKGKHSVKGTKQASTHNVANEFCNQFLEPFLGHILKRCSFFCFPVGLGRTAPDPSAAATLEGVQVPLGKGVNTNIDDTSLLYNEYPLTPDAGCANRLSGLVFTFCIITSCTLCLQAGLSPSISRDVLFCQTSFVKLMPGCGCIPSACWFSLTLSPSQIHCV